MKHKRHSSNRLAELYRLISHSSGNDPSGASALLTTSNEITFDLTGIGGHSIPIEVIDDGQPGPVLCLTAGIHGDELNGIEIVRQLAQRINRNSIKGTIIAIPVVNIAGYFSGLRTIEKNCDLNRCFPGDKNGTYPHQVAHAFFSLIASCCDFVVDVHTGSSGMENLPQLRVDLTKIQNTNLLSEFRKIAVVQNTAPRGSLRWALTVAEIPAIVMEIGGSLELQPESVCTGVHALESLLNSLRMIDPPGIHLEDQHYFHGGGWIRAEVAGIFISKVKLGDDIKAEDIVGEIINPLASSICEVKAPLNCTILGKSHNQMVTSGFGLFRVGLK